MFLFFLSWQAKGRLNFPILVERRPADKKMFLSRPVGDKIVFLYFLILASQGQADFSDRSGEAAGG